MDGIWLRGSGLIFRGWVMSRLLRHRSVGDMVVFTVLVVAVLSLLAVAPREQENPPPVETVALTQEQRSEVVARWYAEVYPAYGVAPRR